MEEVSDISIVRETLSEDLIERFIIDILEITEKLSSKSFKKNLISPLFIYLLSLNFCYYLGTEGSIMLTSTTSKNPAEGIHHPDKDHGRPEKVNFGGHGAENAGGGQEQSGFSRQCWKKKNFF